MERREVLRTFDFLSSQNWVEKNNILTCFKRLQDSFFLWSDSLKKKWKAKIKSMKKLKMLRNWDYFYLKQKYKLRISFCSEIEDRFVYLHKSGRLVASQSVIYARIHIHRIGTCLSWCIVRKSVNYKPMISKLKKNFQ